MEGIGGIASSTVEPLVVVAVLAAMMTFLPQD